MLDVNLLKNISPFMIGLFPKFTCIPPANWCVCPETEHITEICSVSRCISCGPPIGFDDHGCSSAARYHPPYWATERSIGEWIRPRNEWHDYSKKTLWLYAYRTFPLQVGTSKQEHKLLEIEAENLFARRYSQLILELDDKDYERLGYDIVEFLPSLLLDFEPQFRSANSYWSGAGHSPLSCNGLAHLYAVNQYCLFDEAQAALEAAKNIGWGESEPTSYVIVEVLRKRIPYHEIAPCE